MKDLGTSELDWVELRDFITYMPVDSALMSVLAGWDSNIRFSQVLAAQQINEIRMFAAGFSGQQPELLDLTGSGEDTNSLMSLQHKPSRLSVAELNKRIGWTQPDEK